MTKFNDDWATSPIRSILMQNNLWNITFDNADFSTKSFVSDSMIWSRMEREFSWNLRWSLIKEISENI